MTTLLLGMILSLCDVQRYNSIVYPDKSNPEWMDTVRATVTRNVKTMKIRSLTTLAERKKDIAGVRWLDFTSNEMTNISTQPRHITYWIVTDVCQRYERIE